MWRRLSTHAVTTKKLWARFPELEQLKQEKVLRFLEITSVFGIPTDAGAEIAVKYPASLSLTESNIAGTVAALRNCGFSEEHKIKLLRKYPQVFHLPKSEFGDRIAFLNTYFENNKESLKAILNSLEALTEAEQVVKRKLRYLIFNMAHATSSIKNCSVLSYPFQFIKLRHEFLIKAGLYVPIPYRKLIKVREKEKLTKLPRQKYFRPDDIVCTTDAQFLKLTRGAFTANDLAAFEEIFVVGQEDEDAEDIFLNENDKDDMSISDDEDDEDEDQLDSLVIHSVGFGNKAEMEHFYF